MTNNDSPFAHLENMTDPFAHLADVEFNGRKLKLPPPIFVDMQSEVRAVDLETKTMRVRFPQMERYQNPVGITQGGIIVTMMDNTIGPLSYMIAPTSLTTQLNTTYLRPALPSYAYIEVLGEVTEQTRNQLFLKATAFEPSGKILAFAHATCRVLGS